MLKMMTVSLCRQMRVLWKTSCKTEELQKPEVTSTVQMLFNLKLI
jgi:hypothetical protein